LPQWHPAAPPRRPKGIVTTVLVTPGRGVRRGEVLIAIEARDGVVDLLIERGSPMDQRQLHSPYVLQYFGTVTAPSHEAEGS